MSNFVASSAPGQHAEVLVPQCAFSLRARSFSLSLPRRPFCCADSFGDELAAYFKNAASCHSSAVLIGSLIQ